MSRWTHIVAAIDFDTFRENDNLISEIIADLKMAPKITGSEKDAEIFINQLSGYNVSSYNIDGIPHEYQTRVAITILGDLRDRYLEDTQKEWEQFVGYIENLRGVIRNISVNIQGENKRWK